MAGYQQITIIGYAGRDAEIKYLKDGTALTSFSVAVNKITGKGQSRKETSTWFDVTVWGERAETIAQYVKKGMQVCCIGEVSVTASTNKQSGNPVAYLHLNAIKVVFLSRVEEPEQQEEQEDFPF